MAVRYAMNKNKYLIDPEVDRLEASLKRTFETIDQNTPSTIDISINTRRDALILSLALRTGARASELLQLRHADINSYDSTIFIHGIKGSNDREIPLHGPLFAQLQTHASEMPKNEGLFPIGYHRLRQIWDWHRPAAKKFHCLRHTFAIRLYRKTKDIRLVQVALGHRNITNTMVYADYIYSQQELKKLIL
jgi:integrase